jgi:hypothetical protein
MQQNVSVTITTTRNGVLRSRLYVVDIDEAVIEEFLRKLVAEGIYHGSGN